MSRERVMEVVAMHIRRTLVAEFSIRALIAAFVGVSLVGVPVLTAPASADPAPFVWASAAGDPSTGNPDGIFGQEFAPNTSLTVTVNAVAVSDPPATDDIGDFRYGPPDFDLNSGDLLEVSDGVTTKSLTLVGLNFDTMHYGTGAATGTSDEPDGAQVELTAAASDGTVPETLTATVTSGTWSADFTTDISRAFVFASIGDGDGDATIADAPGPPYLQVFPDGNNVVGYDWPEGETVVVEIDDPVTPTSPDYVATSVVGEPCPPGPCGPENPENFAINSAPYDIKAGDLVTAEVVSDPLRTASHNVQPLSVTDVDYAADTVTGTTAPGNSVSVMVTPFLAVRNLVADGAGNWTADFSVPGPSGEPPYDLTQADYNILVQAGDQFGPGSTAIFAPPPVPPTPGPTFTVFVSADFSSTEGIGGFAFVPSSQVTVTVDLGADGSVDYEATDTVDAAGGVGWFGPGVPTIDEGDLVTLTDDLDPPTVKIHVVDYFTLDDVDSPTDTLTGTGRAGTELHARAIDSSLPFPEGPDVIATVDGAGQWTANFSGIFDITAGDDGWVQTVDPDGDHTQINWGLPLSIGPVDVEMGDVLISQTDGVLWVYDPDSGSLVDYHLPFGGTWDIQWDGPDTILIANSGEGRIWQLSLSTGDLDLVAESDPLSFPIGLALDPTDGDALWIADHNTGILRLDRSTGVVTVVVPPFGGQPDGIVVASDGTVYFTNQSGVVYRVAQELLQGYESVVDVGPYGLNGLVFDASGSLLATSIGPPAVVEIDVGTGAFMVNDYSTEMRSSEDTAVGSDGSWWVIDSGFVTEFGDDSGLYLVDLPRTNLSELLRGEPLGDTVDLLIVDFATSNPPQSKADCKRGDWQNFTDDEGTPFRNQGQCVSYVASSGWQGNGKIV